MVRQSPPLPRSPSNQAQDWKQVKEFYEQPLFEKLKERGRMNQATLKSLGWPFSLKAFKIRHELAKAHHRILSVRRRARQGFVVTEDQEKAAYGDYATYLCVLEDLTGPIFPLIAPGKIHS